MTFISSSYFWLDVSNILSGNSTLHDFSWICYVSDLQNWKGETEEVENHWEGSTWMKSYIIKTHFGYHMDLVDTGYDLDMTIYTSCYYK